MLIANPIYDTVFKHLLENHRVAKFFIGTLLGKPILSISPRAPERTYISTDPKGRKELEDERYYRQYVDDTFGGLYREIEDKNRAIAKKDAELAELKRKLERYEGK
jgi:hypothetical protein